MLLITDLTGNVLASFSGDNNTLKSVFPDDQNINKKYNEYFFDDDRDVLDNPTKYKIENGQYILKPLSPITLEEIKAKYQPVLDDLLKQKIDAEIMGEPTDTIISEYRNQKTLMEDEIKKAGLTA